jgi:hypothetical protein
MNAQIVLFVQIIITVLDMLDQNHTKIVLMEYVVIVLLHSSKNLNFINVLEELSQFLHFTQSKKYN